MREHLYKGFYPNKSGTTEITLNGVKIKGEWIEGDSIIDYCTGQYFIHAHGDSVNESDKVHEEGCLKFFAFEVIPETVGEYTGLFDKNGKKIFEGNILEFKDEYGIWRSSVVFERGLFGIDVYNKKQVKNPENWNKEYPIVDSRGWGCTWGYEEFGTAHTYRKPLARATLYTGQQENWENSDYYKLHSKCGWEKYFTMSAEVIGNIYENPELLEAQNDSK